MRTSRESSWLGALDVPKVQRMADGFVGQAAGARVVAATPDSAGERRAAAAADSWRASGPDTLNSKQDINKTGLIMKAFRVAILALAIAGGAQARPIVFEEVATLTRPDPSWEYFGRFGVAIDGDFALVSGERFVADPGAPSGQRHEGAAFLYQRSGASWSFVQQLGPVTEILEHVVPGLAMKDGVAVTMTGNARVFERSGTTWTWTSYIDYDLQGGDIEVSDARILIPRLTCSYSHMIARDLGGLWGPEALLNGNPSDCEFDTPSGSGDIQGTLAVAHSPRGVNGELPVARFYRRTDNSWTQFTQLQFDGTRNLYGNEVALAGPYFAVTGPQERGTSIAYLVNGSSYAWASTGLQPVDGYMQDSQISATSIERAGARMFAQRNYSFDRGAFVINVFRVNDDPGHSSTHVATLQSRRGTSVGPWVDSCGNRIIVGGGSGGFSGDDVVRIYELPTSFETPAVQVHDFESPSAGALWQPSAGSSFSVVRTGNTHVYRQTIAAGQASAWLPASAQRNQAIQAEVTIRRVVGTNAWVGLLTRRSDGWNYYYVTLRSSGNLELKRRVNGTHSTLASSYVGVGVGERHRLRLESIGTAHRVYLDDRLVLTARDAALTQGTAGVVMYRASADYDNVLVTPSPLTTIYYQDFWTGSLELWERTSGSYQIADGVLHQRYVGGYARASIGTPTTDQVVQARLRAVRFEGPDYYMGLMARYLDDRNNLYVTLRPRGVVSLWKRSNGVITQLATRAMPVSEGTWYQVRVEIVNGLTRVYVDDQPMLSTHVDPGPTAPSGSEARGKVGLITYKTWADFDDFRAYQP
jgi:hypothetical protein